MGVGLSLKSMISIRTSVNGGLLSHDFPSEVGAKMRLLRKGGRCSYICLALHSFEAHKYRNTTMTSFVVLVHK
jgi:hypothetical protein